MEVNDEELTKELLRVLQRCHHCKPKFKGDGDLANIEFFMLLGLAAFIEQKEKSGESGVTLGEFVKAGGMSLSAASRKISIFEKKGYVKREASKEDHRKVYIHLTQKGLDICEREKQKKNQMLRELIAQMGETDMKQLIVLSNKAVDILENINRNT